MTTREQWLERETFVMLTEFSARISRYFGTAEEAAAFAAQFPKSMRLTTQEQWLGRYAVSLHTILTANGTNGGVNEAGIKRARRFLTALIDSGTTITYAQITNGITVEEFLAATA
jgi:hypothetical protein